MTSLSLFLITNVDSIVVAHNGQPIRQAYADCVRSYPVTQDVDCLGGLYPSVQPLPDKISEMARRKLGLFRMGTTAPTASAIVSGTEMPKLTANDFVFDTGDIKLWTLANMTPVKDMSSDTWIVQYDPQMHYRAPLNLCLADYTYLYLRMRASADTETPIQVFYLLDGKGEFNETQSIRLPLIWDGQEHEYSYDLSLLAAPSGSWLTDFRFDPVYKGTSASSQVQIHDLRLIRSDQATKCADATKAFSFR